jgi:hypothetical protein
MVQKVYAKIRGLAPLTAANSLAIVDIVSNRQAPQSSVATAPKQQPKSVNAYTAKHHNKETVKMTTFATTAINEYDSNIARIEEQINQLQQALSQQQSERQNVQSIEQMGMSAIGQVMKTLAACNHAGLPELANSFKKQAMAVLNDGSDSNDDDDVEALPAADDNTPPSATAITPPPPQAPTDDEVLETIKALDEEHMTENYLPIYLYRAALPQLTRKEQDEALYRLEADDRIELSALQEVRVYTDEQIKAGIPQDVGGRLFFIVVEDEERRSHSLQSAAKPATASVGAAAAADIGLMDFNELKEYCLGTLRLSKDEVRKHGKLTRRETWVSALKSLS